MKQINPYKAFFTVFLAGLLIPPFIFFIMQVWYSCIDPVSLHSFIDRIQLLKLALTILAGAALAALSVFGICNVLNSDKLKKWLRISVIILCLLIIIWLFFNPVSSVSAAELNINLKRFALQAFPVILISAALLWLLKER